MMKHIFWALLFVAAIIYLSVVWMWIEEGNRKFDCQSYIKTLETNK
jgi:hypothetical protein